MPILLEVLRPEVVSRGLAVEEFDRPRVLDTSRSIYPVNRGALLELAVEDARLREDGTERLALAAARSRRIFRLVVAARIGKSVSRVLTSKQA